MVWVVLWHADYGEPGWISAYPSVEAARDAVRVLNVGPDGEERGGFEIKEVAYGLQIDPADADHICDVALNVNSRRHVSLVG